MERYENLVFETREGVALLTLNNPDQRNPLTEETKTEMIRALDSIKEEGDIRSLLITGAGKAFCAGGDVKNIGRELADDEIRQVMLKSQKLLKGLLNLEKPVVCAVNGDAFGMGCNLALASDFVIASERARFCEVFVKLGLVPDFGALYILPRLVGLSKSKELAYLGTVLSAKEAEEMGLVYKVVPHEELEREAMDLALRLASMPTLAIGRAKRLLNRAFDMTLDQVLEEEIKAQTRLSRTEDHREGIGALRDRRKPGFKGR